MNRISSVQRLGLAARRVSTLRALAQLHLHLRARGGRLTAEVHPTASIGSLSVTKVDGPHAPNLTLRLGEWARLGSNLAIELNRTIDRANELVVEDHAWVRDGLWLRLDGGRGHVGRRAWIGAHSSLHVPGGLIALGEHAVVGLGCQIHAVASVEVGPWAALGHDVTVVDSDHVADGSSRWFLEQGSVTAPIIIGANTVVSAGARITRGARIGANSMVGANAVVRSGTYEDSILLAGAPANPLRSLVDRPIAAAAPPIFPA